MKIITLKNVGRAGNKIANTWTLFCSWGWSLIIKNARRSAIKWASSPKYSHRFHNPRILTEQASGRQAWQTLIHMIKMWEKNLSCCLRGPLQNPTTHCRHKPTGSANPLPTAGNAHLLKISCPVFSSLLWSQQSGILGGQRGSIRIRTVTLQAHVFQGNKNLKDEGRYGLRGRYPSLFCVFFVQHC